MLQKQKRKQGDQKTNSGHFPGLNLPELKHLNFQSQCQAERREKDPQQRHGGTSQNATAHQMAEGSRSRRRGGLSWCREERLRAALCTAHGGAPSTAPALECEASRRFLLPGKRGSQAPPEQGTGREEQDTWSCGRQNSRMAARSPCLAVARAWPQSMSRRTQSTLGQVTSRSTADSGERA